MNKTIWIINQYTGSPYHGMNYRSYYLAKEFIKKGHEVIIFSGSYSHLFVNYPETKGLFTEEYIDGIKFIWVKTPKYKKSKSILRIINMFSFMIILFFFNIFKLKKPNKIIVSSLSIFPVLNAYLWSKILKISFVFEVRDIWPLTLIELGSLSKKHILVKILAYFESFGYKKAEKVISLLKNSREHMIKRGMHPNKFVYIPNGIYLDEVKNRKSLSLNLVEQIPKNKFIIGYIGTIGIANALEYLVKSAENVQSNRDIHFVIVGNGGEKNKLIEYVKSNKLLNITFIDHIPKVQVQSLLEHFDICYIGWHRSELYKLGVSANKIFDYMYSKKPILQSISLQDNIVNESACGISVDAEDIEAIAEAILKLYKMNKEDLKIMGLNGNKYVLEKHSYKKLSEIYLEFL